MPYYSYQCSKCEITFRTFHGMNEEQEECKACLSKNSELKRVYDKISVRTSTPTKTSAGSRVKDFIKDSKEVLEQQKSEANVEHD
jgi:putative FmdB family regulatory protein|tara:strand:+ start:606 stop:860 length:255 start_codon:yes stop_codon:yes gene_type:complete